MIAKLLPQDTFFVAATGALLFASAGTLHWPGAWPAGYADYAARVRYRLVPGAW
jgi:hypothetical protein